MTIDFRFELQIINSQYTTVDTVPVDFKLDNFMLRGAMRVFMPTFTKHLKRLFYY